MFERFTDRARRVVVLAQENARLLSHNYIGSEHLLLGLLDEGEGVAFKVLESLGVDVDEIRDYIKEIIGEGKTSPAGHIPFTPRSKKIMELALREALQLGHSYVGTEHLLLGLAKEGEGVGMQALLRAGVEHNKIRQATIQLLAEYETPKRIVNGDVMADEVGVTAAEAKDMSPSQLPEYWRWAADRTTTARALVYRAAADDLEAALKNVKI